MLAPIATCISSGNLTSERSDHLAGIPKGEHAVRDVGCDDASHPDEAVLADADTIAHHGPAAQGGAFTNLA
jgi:hypothetical protein